MVGLAAVHLLTLLDGFANQVDCRCGDATIDADRHRHISGDLVACATRFQVRCLHNGAAPTVPRALGATFADPSLSSCDERVPRHRRRLRLDRPERAILVHPAQAIETETDYGIGAQEIHELRLSDDPHDVPNGVATR